MWPRWKIHGVINDSQVERGILSPMRVERGRCTEESREIFLRGGMWLQFLMVILLSFKFMRRFLNIINFILFQHLWGASVSCSHWSSEWIIRFQVVARSSQVVLVVKNQLPMQETQETWVSPLGQEDPLKEEITTYSTVLTWEIPWTEDPGSVQSVELQSWTWLNE